ncbi:MAG: TonB-dependent receptor [Gemmatimonadales bacterium]|nr:TonB-dependent receptor [Gemmatimonadales bacterium]NIR02935.1 TonB-dependent receptor [Gemmatimonadales bacterium]
MRLTTASILLVVCCGLVGPRPLPAQAVRGVVTAVATGGPLDGARVELAPTGGDPFTAVLTGADGSFFLAAPTAGEYVLQVTLPGYRPQLARLLLRDDLVIEVRVNLARAEQAIGALNLEGRVLTAGEGKPLSDVRVRVIESAQSARTDEAGHFAIAGVPRPARILFQRIGVKSDTVLLAAGQPFVTVYLELAPVRLPAVEAVAATIERRRFESLAQSSTMSLDKSAIETTPTLAEPDVARTVQLLPGTVAKNDFYVGFNVRGGEADQNLIRLDGITVFNPSHVGGLFSTFDQAAIDRLDFITGGFPAHFGGRMSSVLDVQLRRGSPEHRLHGNLSLLSSKVMLEGPVGSTGVNYMVGARRSYVDLLTAPFPGTGVPYYFADALAKVTTPLPTGGIASLTAYWGRDALDWPFIEAEPGRDGVDIEVTWGNRLAGLSVRHGIGALELEQHASVSAFSTRLAMAPDIERLDNGARVLTAGLSGTFRFGSANHIAVGGDVEDYQMDLSRRSDALETVEFELAYSPRVWSGYLDAQWELFKRVQLRPGVRVERVTGGADRTVVAPRVAVKAFLTNNFALTGSAGRFYQAVHSIRDQDVPLTMFDFWIGADDVTPIADADHVVVGFQQWFGGDVMVGVEGYNKTYHDLVVRSFRDDPW